MNHNCIYTFKSRTEDGQEHICVFRPRPEENWWAVQIDEQGVDVTQFLEDEDFNEVSQWYADRFGLGNIISRDRKFVFSE